MSIWGTEIDVSIFGESHGRCVGGVAKGFPCGISIDEALIAQRMRERQGGSALTTPRKESDVPQFLSGIKNGFTTGAPIAVMIENANTRSSDYRFDEIPRPSHSDYTALARYGGYADLAGGGHFSGRLTAPIVCLGTIAESFLKTKGIEVCVRMAAAGNYKGKYYEELSAEEKGNLFDTDIPTPAAKEIEEAAKEGDSVGAILEAVIRSMPKGLGEPSERSIESRMSAMLFSIPGVKGVEFGSGFALASMRGSESNDCFVMTEKGVLPKTNRNGGILGGITSGADIVVRCALKATASISKTQSTLNLKTKEMTELSIKGRHDPCIGVRALPVLRAALSLVAMDIYLEAYGYATDTNQK